MSNTIRSTQRVLALQHVAINPPGLVGEALRRHRIPYDIVQVANEALPDPTQYSAIVSFGGIQHVYEEGETPYHYIKQEEKMLHTAVEIGIPVLGICLGSQILAHAFGANVKAQPPAKIGFLEIQFTPEGQQDPIYQGFTNFEQAFHWHGDIFENPAGATLLAHHNSGKHHAFRIGQHAYGLQYHVELTAQMLEHWLNDPSSRHDFIEDRGIKAYNKVIQERPQLYPLYHTHSQLLIENFLRISHLIN
ncbi:type 1 glutamine amidotransferase [Dictyobacter arantiisoli]|uniref:Glutamine amidotransferase n=1 Tax=Dictyobacter arantiisoli TaxID=2014874 RepID=A0A5A5TF95_9CHLR|nr:type 1 glutamine amidotransferase [Dictyobacter arantiisoli]GCF09743.1 glutamine amidotransferase [Dictyobacter arantiisoli]